MRRLARPIFAIDCNHVPANQIFARCQANDPLRAALTPSGAMEATPRGFCMLGADRELQSPMLSKDYEVRTLPARPVKAGCPRGWRKGIRFGPNASGEGPDEATSAECAPPTLRKACIR